MASPSLRPAFLVVILVIASLSAATPAAANGSASFEATTEPSPAGATMQGEWQLNGYIATLKMRGGHLLPVGYTSFVGTWTAPLTVRQKRPSIKYQFDFLLANDLDFLEPISFLVRSRRPGNAWSRWNSVVVRFRPDSHSASGEGLFRLNLPTPQRMQFQWRMRGEIRGPAAVQAVIRLEVASR